jgi:hypothetical protein
LQRLTQLPSLRVDDAITVQLSYQVQAPKPKALPSQLLQLLISVECSHISPVLLDSAAIARDIDIRLEGRYANVVVVGNHGIVEVKQPPPTPAGIHLEEPYASDEGWRP